MGYKPRWFLSHPGKRGDKKNMNGLFENLSSISPPHKPSAVIELKR